MGLQDSRHFNDKGQRISAYEAGFDAGRKSLEAEVARLTAQNAALRGSLGKMYNLIHGDDGEGGDVCASPDCVNARAALAVAL